MTHESPAVNTMHTTVYSADGYKLNIVMAIEAIEDINIYLDQIRAAGLTPNIPGLEPGQEKETIAAVVRRASKKGTPVIDFYANWQYEGKFGAHKYAHMYLDTPEQIAEFEAQSGLRLADIPLYEGQSAIHREYGRPTRFETDVKHSFEIVRTPDGQHDTGMAKYIYSYAAPMPMATAPQTPPKQAATSPKSNAPAQPSPTTSATPENAPTHGEERQITLTAVISEQGKTGQTRYRFASVERLEAVYAYSREVFINGGWCTELDWQKHGTYDLEAACVATVQYHAFQDGGGGYWTVEAVENFQPDFLADVAF